jgi:hypothetical protein
MPHFLVTNEAGPAWDARRGMREQELWTEHAQFINALESERFVVLGGPVHGTARHTAILVVRAPDEPTVRRRFADDPWIRSGHLTIAALHPWEILIGAPP